MTTGQPKILDTRRGTGNWAAILRICTGGNEIGLNCRFASIRHLIRSGNRPAAEGFSAQAERLPARIAPVVRRNTTSEPFDSGRDVRHLERPDASLAPADHGARQQSGLLFMDAFGSRPWLGEMVHTVAGHGRTAPDVFHRSGHAPALPIPGLGDPNARGAFSVALGSTRERLTARRARTRPPDSTGSRARSSSLRPTGPGLRGRAARASPGGDHHGGAAGRAPRSGRVCAPPARLEAAPDATQGPLHLGDPPGRAPRLHHARHSGVHEERYKRPMLERSFRRGNKTRFVRCLRWRGTDLRPVRFASPQQPAGFEKAFPRDRRGA